MKKDVPYIADLVEKLAEKQDKQADVLSDIKVSVARQETAFDAHLKQDEQMYSKINQMDDKLGKYNQLLEVHIEGVNQLRRTNDILEKQFDSHKKNTNERLEKLEEPGMLKSLAWQRLRTTAKTITYAGTILGGVLFILHALAKILKII
jgi:chromosome segregation ATPase